VCFASNEFFRNGYSQHGDYVFGWKDDSLQRAMDARCTGDVCSVLESQTTEKAMECTIPRTVEEDIDGCEFTHVVASAAHNGLSLAN
jgi:hypothetical protein